MLILGVVMDSVTFPIDPASIATAIAVAGGTIIVVGFGAGIGFFLLWRLYQRVGSAVGASRSADSMGAGLVDRTARLKAMSDYIAEKDRAVKLAGGVGFDASDPGYQRELEWKFGLRSSPLERVDGT